MYGLEYWLCAFYCLHTAVCVVLYSHNIHTRRRRVRTVPCVRDLCRKMHVFSSHTMSETRTLLGPRAWGAYIHVTPAGSHISSSRRSRETAGLRPASNTAVYDVGEDNAHSSLPCFALQPLRRLELLDERSRGSLVHPAFPLCYPLERGADGLRHLICCTGYVHVRVRSQQQLP